MSNFKLPNISPLAGSSFATFLKVLKSNRVAPRYYSKVVLTAIMIFINSVFRWLDPLLLNKKVNKFNFEDSPLFIIGHWRSGTTFLHNLLTKDPSTGFVTTYQSVFANNLKSKWLFKTFMTLFMPSERPGDSMKIAADFPQEDEFAMSNITDLSFYHFFYFPTKYRAYYDRSIRFKGVGDKEEKNWMLNYRRMVTKALINTNGKRAVLKNPANTGRMLTLKEIFPNAYFVFLIRNPIIVYLSTKKFFIELFPTVNLESFSNEEISDLVLELYSKLLHAYLADKEQLAPESIIEVSYETLIRNPIEELENIYYQCDLGDFEELRPRFKAYLDSQSGHKIDSYTIEENELEKVLGKLNFAMEHWNYSIPEGLNVIGKENIQEKVLAD